MFNRIKRSIENFNQVLAEGNYRVPPMTWGRLIRGSLNPELPATSEVAVGTTMIDYGKSLGTKFMWASIFALSMTAIKWAAIGFALLGSAVYTAEYFRAKKSREDKIVEINFAGQRVKGRRADLYRLHRAQLRIMNITSSLEGASAATTADAVRAILDTVKDERGRVEVLDGGRYHAGREAYAFSEPDFRLVLDEAKVAEEAKPAALPDQGSLREAFAKKTFSADDIADRFVALQESLPPEVMERVKARLQPKPQA